MSANTASKYKTKNENTARAAFLTNKHTTDDHKIKKKKKITTKKKSPESAQSTLAEQNQHQHSKMYVK